MFDFSLDYNHRLRRDDPVSQLAASLQVGKSSVPGCGKQQIQLQIKVCH